MHLSIEVTDKVTKKPVLIDINKERAPSFTFTCFFFLLFSSNKANEEKCDIGHRRDAREWDLCVVC